MPRKFDRSGDEKNGSAWLHGRVSIKSQKLNNYGGSGADRPPLSGDFSPEGESEPRRGEPSVSTIVRK